MESLEKLVVNSLRFRKQLPIKGNCLRLFAGVSDGIEGLNIDQFGEFIVATLYNSKINSHLTLISKAMKSVFPQHHLLLKLRSNSKENEYEIQWDKKTPPPSCLTAQEENVFFEIRTDPRDDFGLYLDTKSARKFVKSNSKDKNVLNLFSYTCAFGIYSMLGGARSVTNVDPSKPYLEWAKTNANLNNIQFKCYPDTTQEYLARHLRRLDSGKDAPYDFIIFDPPAFLVGRGADRLARNLWPTWFEMLSSTQCQEFLFVINDKNILKDGDPLRFLKEGLKKNMDIMELEQSHDVLGQGLSDVSDAFYAVPRVFHIRL